MRMARRLELEKEYKRLEGGKGRQRVYSTPIDGVMQHGRMSEKFISLYDILYDDGDKKGEPADTGRTLRGT